MIVGLILIFDRRMSGEDSSHDQSSRSFETVTSSIGRRSRLFLILFNSDFFLATPNHIPLRPPPTSSSSSTTSNSPNQPMVSLHPSSSSSSSSSNVKSMRKDKTTRMRTVLNEKQLLTLRTCYGANPRPDALMKERLVEMTSLSPRVIRVWFQNKRKTRHRSSRSSLSSLFCTGCKDKKRTILVKQTQDQQKVLGSLNHGIPLIASSPVSNDMNMGLPPPSLVQVQYHSGGPWKTFNAYPSGHPMRHQQQQQQQSYHDLAGFGSEDDSTCFDTSQFSEERSDTSCDGSGTSQLTLL